MESGEKAPQKYQSMFVFMGILFLAEWVLYSLHLMRRWQQIDPSLRTDASSLAVFAIGLWVLLIRERGSGYAMAMLAFVFGASWGLALHLILLAKSVVLILCWITLREPRILDSTLTRQEPVHLFFTCRRPHPIGAAHVNAAATQPGVNL
jgi:hypothetical protein